MLIISIFNFLAILFSYAPCFNDSIGVSEPRSEIIQEPQLKSKDSKGKSEDEGKSKKANSQDSVLTQPQLKNSALDRRQPADKVRLYAVESISEWPLDLTDKKTSAQNSLNAKLVSQNLEKKQRAEPNSDAISKVPFLSEIPFETKPVEDAKISPELLKRKSEIEECLKYYYRKPVNADVLRPWSVMHGVLGYGQNSQVVSRGNRINAVDYLCHNGIGNDRRILKVENGKLSAAVGPGFQGHEGQLLAILAQVKTPIDRPLVVDGHQFTLRDLVEYEKASCRPGTELTFKLIGLSVYLKTDEIWKDSAGQNWDISRLMYEEMAQPINGAACGGTHRLMGLSYALAVRKARNEPVDGQWKRAENFIANYHQQALALQTTDGGFSTEFFEGLSNSQDPIRQLYSTGHILEWFCVSMTEEQLTSAPVSRMVDRLLALMAAEFHPDQTLDGKDVGPKGHALRALRLYELRLFGKPSNHQEFESLDKRPLISAKEIPALQQGLRTIAASGVEGGQYLQAGSQSSSTKSAPTMMPAARGGTRFMRRR